VLEDLVRDTLNLCAIPAPTFAEGARATAVATLLTEAGLQPVVDAAGNVLARVGGAGPAIVVAAHLDTVFPADTVLEPRRDRGRLYGPGIGDDSVAVATLIELGRHLAAVRRAPRVPVLLAATVGEEGLGDLRGIRAVLDEHPATAVIALEGHGIDSVVTAGIASARYVVTYRGPGGHSWRDRDRPSALHVLFDTGRAAIAEGAPASVNIGVVSGGLSINSIAGEARMEIDIRAETDDVVDRACARIEQVLAAVPRGIDAQIVQAGRRPGGQIDPAHPLLREVRRARTRAGLPPAREDSASTDANAALGRGIPAITLGLTRGAAIHRADEWIELAPLAAGVATVVHLVHHLAGLPAPRGLV
jgi:acetylornithine deacetylase/succinyl-diaminopimelate desuccinylase-like protein